jgi:DNA-binding MarR family transcriptional regulator
MTTTSETGPRPGLASPVARLADQELAAWRAFLLAHALLVRRLDDELQTAIGLSLAEYDALVQLVNAPVRRLRMSALAERVLLSRSGITRLVDRLVAAGFVARTVCPTDARGAEAAITPAGVDVLRAATVTHLGGVQRYFTGVISEADQAVLAASLELVADRLGQPGASSTLCGTPEP